MTEIQEISIHNIKIVVKVERSSIAIYKNNQLRCSGFKESIDYLLYHCYFNDFSNEEALTIIEAYQDYYIKKLLQVEQKEQRKLTEFLFWLHDIITSYKYRMKFFRKLYRDKKFRHNYEFWQLIFDTYFDSGNAKVGKFASRILLRNNPYDSELWEILTELENDINYRKSVVKKIVYDIKKNDKK